MKTSLKRILALTCVVTVGMMSMASCRKNPSSEDTSSDDWGYESEYIDYSSEDNNSTDANASGDENQTSGDNTSNSSKNSNSSKTSGGSANSNSSKTSGGSANSASSKTSGGSANSNDLAEKYRGTTVKFATWEPHTTNEAAPVIKNFTKKYGIKVQIVAVPQGDYIQTVTGKIASGEAPDVIHDNGEVPAALDILQPITVADTIDLSDPIWDQGFIKNATFNGKVYEVNTIGNNWGIYGICFFNKTLLKNAGISQTPEDLYKAGKWNWENLETMIRTYTQNMGKGNYGLQITSDMNMLSSVGAGFYQFRDGKVFNGLDNPLTAKVLTKTSDWVHKNYATYASTAFSSRKAAIIFDSTWSLKKTGFLKDMSNFNEVGFTYLPDFDANNKATPINHWRGYGISQRSKNPGGAGLFLRYFLDGNNYSSDIFISSEAETFFYQLVSKIDYKGVSYDATTGVNHICGVSFDQGYSTFTTFSRETPVNEVDGKLTALKPVMDTNIEKANKRIQTATK